MLIQTMELINVVTPHSAGAEVEGGIGSREPYSFLGNLWKAHPLQEETVWMDRVNRVHGIQPRQGFQGKAANQGGLEEALG